MGGPSLEMSSPERESEGRLDSWKEIAAYLNRDVTTVQRWEKREGMPVHRHLHDKRGSVYASRAELDAWARSRNVREADENETGTEVPDAPVFLPTPARYPFTTKRNVALLLAGAVTAALAVAVFVWLRQTEYFWQNPIRDARFVAVTDFGGAEQAAAVSRDGQFIAFLSDRDGQVDVWVTQVGSGQFHNLTGGSAPEIANSSLRTVGFSPDGSFVTYWTRRKSTADNSEISVWSVPTLGGPPRPYLEGVAEFDWSSDGSRLAYHTPGPGDPLFVSAGSIRPKEQPIFTAPAGLHDHFPLWSADGKFIYFVRGSLPDKLDIWRIRAEGGVPERITSHNSRVSYPVLYGRRTLFYLATDPDGSGPWLYSIDVERRIPHRLAPGLDRYTSLGITADSHRLVATLAVAKRTLWLLQLAAPHKQSVPSTPIPISTGSGFYPRLGPGYLLYVSSTRTGESLWKLTDGVKTELWNGENAQFLGSPAISQDGRFVAFSVRQHGQALLYEVQTDGSNARVVTSSLNLQGDPAWAPDGKSVISAAIESGVPHLFQIPVDGKPADSLVHEYSLDPVWAPDGSYVVYSGADIGTTFSMKAVTGHGAAQAMPAVTLTRGARHVVFLSGGRSLVVLRDAIEHKNLSQIDLDTGAERQLTNLPSDFEVRDFDISPDGREVVLERVQERSDVVLMDIQSR